MGTWNQLMRDYEERHFPVSRRLDVHAEGPLVARDLTLRWLRSRAHEDPGSELLVIAERGVRPGREHGAVWRAVESLLNEMQGKLLDWWHPFGPGSLAIGLSRAPDVLERPVAKQPEGEGRTPETAGERYLATREDVPPELWDSVERIAEMRRERQGLSVGLLEVVSRRVWIDAQAAAMNQRIGFDEALQEIASVEERLFAEMHDE